MLTFGKVIGGGLPIGAFGGKKEIMNILAPSGKVYQAGTLAGNPISLSAGISTLSQISKQKNFYEKLRKKTLDLFSTLKEGFSKKGITSFAVSARAKEGKTGDLEVVAKMTRKMIEFFLENPPPKRVVININFPFFRHAKEIKGIKFGKLSRAAYGERAIHFQDPRGRDFWFLGSKELKVNSDGVENLKELDYFILEDGFICITPVKIELPVLNIFDEKELSTLSSLVMKEASLLEVSREEP
jgi:hypothetical protein